MKLSIASVIAASWVSCTSAFHVQAPTRQSYSVLSASRSAQKKASRAKWIESRGFSDNVATFEGISVGIMKNDDGLEFMKLVHPNTGASAEVYLFGGVVTSYKDGEGTEFIAVRPDAKMDGSKPISGGLSHCWPQVRRYDTLVQLMRRQLSLTNLAVWSWRNPTARVCSQRHVGGFRFFGHYG